MAYRLARWCCCWTAQAADGIDQNDDATFTQIVTAQNKKYAADIWNVPLFRAHLQAEQAAGKGKGSATHDRPCPAAGLGKCINHDVVVTKGVCINHDVCVHGSVTVQASACITGNVAISGELLVAPGASVCVSGSVLVKGSANVRSDSCVTGAAHVGGALQIEQANVDVGGGLEVEGETRFVARVNPE